MTTRDCDHYTYVRVEEDITYGNVRQFFNKLDEIIENDVLDIVLDLDGVPYITSRGLGAVVHTYTVLSKRGGTLIVVTDSEDVLSSFSVTKLDQILPIEESMEAALARLKAFHKPSEKSKKKSESD